MPRLRARTRVEKTKTKFSQEHPFLFGVTLILMAVALVAGAMAIFNFSGQGGFSSMSSNKLGLANLEGPITQSRELVDFLRQLREDDTVKGVVLRINSPGGSIAPSQEIYAAVQRLAAVKPVVVSMAIVAASGGYYSAAPATSIVANPGTITGSIGVMAQYVNVVDLMNKWGITQDLIVSGKNKGVGTPLQKMTPEQRAYLQAMVMDLHDQFVSDVADARKIDRAELDKVADGRALTGQQALELGLVDTLGGLEDAFELLKQMCEIEGRVPLVEGPVREEPLLKEIIGGLDILPDSAVPEPGWSFSYK